MLEQEAVELRLGQRVGAFLLDRVLGGQHVEGFGQRVGGARHRHVMFLHGLQQGRLGAGARAVDLVGHQELGEDRPFHETERAATLGALLQHLGPRDVGGHQVGRELHAPGFEPQHGAERFHQPGLREAGDAHQQPVPARQQGDERLLNDGLLAEDDGANGGTGRRDAIQRGLGRAGRGGFDRRKAAVLNEGHARALRGRRSCRVRRDGPERGMPRLHQLVRKPVASSNPRLDAGSASGVRNGARFATLDPWRATVAGWLTIARRDEGS